jgi:hypothetical protein
MQLPTIAAAIRIENLDFHIVIALAGFCRIFFAR